MRFIFGSILAVSAALLTGCAYSEAGDASLAGELDMGKELIVLSAPPDGDEYYADVLDDIFTFHVQYAREILKQDNVLILTGHDFYEDYVEALGAENVALIEMQDIWMRDFSPLNAARPVMMRYSAAGQGGGKKGQSDADAVQDVLAEVMDAAGMRATPSDLINDGGNFVDDYAGNVVMSRKFLSDNDLSESEGRAAVRQITGAQHVAFIDADEQGGLEHADGVVAFLSDNVLVINTYPDDPKYAGELTADLKRGLPNVTIHEIITPYDGREIYDSRFGSACGLYTNMLVTPERIYVPQFGIPEDKIAVADIRRWTDKTIVPVSSSGVCKMGGGVRCMSWQTRGPEADALRRYVKGL